MARMNGGRKHGIHDEQVWHYSYWWRGLLLVGSSGGISTKNGPMIPLSLSSDRIFSGVLCYEGEIDDGLLLLTHLLLSGEA